MVVHVQCVTETTEFFMDRSRGPVYCVGIDLGTTTSSVGIWEHGRVTVIPNEYGCRATPSYVTFADGHRIVGLPAKLQANINPTNTIFGSKRLIGRKFSDACVQKVGWCGEVSGE